jgi:hypothetical protein
VLHLAYHEAGYVLYTRSRDSGRTFQAVRKISGPGGTFPALGLDGNGAVYVTWELSDGERSRGLGLALSRDGGASFTAPGVVPHSVGEGWNGSSQGLLMQKLAVNREGALALVNSSLEAGRRSRVWLIRGAAAR